MTNTKYPLEELRFGIMKYSPTPEAVMASTTVSQLLAVPYKYSDAGSNPREFQGMKSLTNKRILESFIKHHKTTFWALHSGVSITVTRGRNESGVLEFEDACLTNGLQTVTIARILTLVKAYQLYTGRNEIHTKINKSMEEKWRECIRNTFPSDVAGQLFSIGLQHVNSVLNWLNQDNNQDCFKTANKMSLEDILNTKISVKAVLLDELANILDYPDGEADLELLGNEIAEANNETQKVDAGDLFGTRYEEWLRKELFGNVRPDTVKIEYRRFAEERGNSNQRVIHVLDLLRAILPTTFIVDSDAEDVASFVADYANRREPIYNWFNKVIKIHISDKHSEMNRAILILRNLMPDLIEVMLLAQRLWDNQRRELSFDVVNSWTPLKNTSLSKQIFEDDKLTVAKQDADGTIKRFLNFSFQNLFTIFIFATRTAIVVTENTNDFEVKYKLEEATASQIIKEIYKNLSKERLKKTLGSTSNLFRDPEIYRSAADLFRLICDAKGQNFHDCTEQYRVLLD